MENQITLTERAASHITGYLAKTDCGFGLRLGVKTTGCSGYQYVIEPAQAITAQDQTFESNGVTIVVDELSMRYLAGTELDYVREGLQEGFRFSNPNVMETCGCGESFSIAR
jgi:iron-sulfur cluster assembly protein